MADPFPSVQPLGYSSPAQEAVPAIFWDDERVTIVIPTRRSAGRVSLTAAATDVFAFAFVPIVWLAFHLFATKRPRAVVRLTRTELTVDETSDDGLGLFTLRRRWPAAAIGELRPNRFGAGLYVTIRGRDSFDLFADLPAEAIRSIADVLAAARDRI